jgi:hypothetical protein
MFPNPCVYGKEPSPQKDVENDIERGYHLSVDTAALLYFDGRTAGSKPQISEIPQASYISGETS